MLNSLAAGIVALLLSYAAFAQSQPTPSEAPQVNAEQKSDAPLKSQQQTNQPEQVTGDKSMPLSQAITPPQHPDTEQNAQHSDDEGTEYWPPLFGYRLKITDSLLALFYPPVVYRDVATCSSAQINCGRSLMTSLSRRIVQRFASGT
jgi:hypothetical protein